VAFFVEFVKTIGMRAREAVNTLRPEAENQISNMRLTKWWWDG